MSTAENEKCGFRGMKDCTSNCKYYLTCTRNPYNKQKAGNTDGNRKEWVDKIT